VSVCRESCVSGVRFFFIQLLGVFVGIAVFMLVVAVLSGFSLTRLGTFAVGVCSLIVVGVTVGTIIYRAGCESNCLAEGGEKKE